MNKVWQDKVDILKEQVWPWWWTLIQMWFEELYEERPTYDISTIWCKEKYGTLRFEFCQYDILLNNIEVASSYICEECWRVWRLRPDLGWWRTLCDLHYKEKIWE